MAKTSQIVRLPNAPLSEVVFELRWALQSYRDFPVILQTDPALLPLLDRFTSAMRKIGFRATKDLAPPSQVAGHSIARRYYKRAELPFPILQIGPGIFASNDGSLYKWDAYKAQTIKGLKALLEAYPKLGVYDLSPNYLELRYIDAFDKSLVGSTSLVDFINGGTRMRIELPPFLADPNCFSGETDGRLLIQRKLVGWTESLFSMDLGSGKSGTTDIVRMETKIVCRGDGVPKLSTKSAFLNKVDSWLEFAHGVASPYFREFVTDAVMAKFKKKKQ